MKQRTALVWFAVGTLVLFTSCSKVSEPGERHALPSPSVSVPLVASSPPPAPTPASAGPREYSGSVEVTRSEPRLTEKQGAPSAWAKDDGQRFAGPVTLKVVIAATGEVTGTLTGALGELSLTGAFDEQTLRAVLVNADRSRETIQNGVVIATEKDGRLSGTLTAATGDGLFQRKGTLSLSRASAAP
jgi:hypothetical protein